MGSKRFLFFYIACGVGAAAATPSLCNFMHNGSQNLPMDSSELSPSKVTNSRAWEHLVV